MSGSKIEGSQYLLMKVRFNLFKEKDSFKEMFLIRDYSKTHQAMEVPEVNVLTSL